MADIRPDWLAQNVEAVIEPARLICDPHHHLWEHARSRYMLDEILDDTHDGHNVVSTVFVECTSGYFTDGPEPLRPVGETGFVEATAEESEARVQSGRSTTRVAQGIVSFADLTLGERVRPVLEAHIEHSPARFRGIRHASAWDASDQIRNSHTHAPEHLLLDREFREGFRCLVDMGLSFDAWLYHPQISDVTDLARAFPGAAIVLDHIGGPIGLGPYRGQGDEVVKAWRRDIAELATCENVHVKLGGLAMPICGFEWHKQEQPPTSEVFAGVCAPYYEYCIEHFGANRCMFESNFPVDKVGISYRTLWNTFKRVASGCSESEKAALFHDTAATFYRLS